MNIYVIGLGIFALLIIAFFAVFRGKGKFTLKTRLGQVRAEGENPANVAAGVRIKDAEAVKGIHAHSASEGGVDLEKVKAKEGISATHIPGQPPPKL